MAPTSVAPPLSVAIPQMTCQQSQSQASEASASEHPQPTQQMQAALTDLRTRVDALEDDLKATFEVMHGGYPQETLLRFLRAREFEVPKAFKMLIDCLKWRVKNDVDNILARPLMGEKYEKVRASQLYGMSGYDKQGRPVLCVRVGLSFMDPSCKLEEYIHSHIQHNEYRDRVLLPAASQRMGRPITSSVKIYDMSGLKLSQLGRMQMHKAVASVDDLNYPEKSEVYYVVNAPTVFGTCWKAVKPLLQDRTRRKVQVLQGNGADELLQDMEEASLPHFVRLAAKEGLGSSKNLLALLSHPATQKDPSLDCSNPAHPYHAAMQAYMLEQRAKAQQLGIPNISIREVSVVDDVDKEKGGEETDLDTVLQETLSQVAISDQA